MKKKSPLISFILILMTWQQILPSAMSVAIPKKCLEDKASLVLFMQDGFGNECVGTCQLDEEIAGQMILQKDLRVDYEQQFDQLFETNDCIDVTHCAKPCDSEIVVYFELDTDVRVLRVLIIKDNLFVDNPFDICCISLQEEQDEFGDLLNEDVIAASENIQTKAKTKASFGQNVIQYSAYVQIYALMKYYQYKRKIKDMLTWFHQNS